MFHSKQIKKLTSKFVKKSQLYGFDGLIQLLKEYSSKENLKTLTIGIIGYPNVGKTSIINGLKRKKKKQNSL